ncbi:E3 ubiquitin-protein ligase ARIH2-like [Chaetodon trifascialis]|uniref:E3 ubiquitin-protein ligase ARIH2-like n=1 Tax=Chaetodon trifascialis TaxID=109706 RepID=UPI003992351B
MLTRLGRLAGLGTPPVKIESNEIIQPRADLGALTSSGEEKCYDPQDKTLRFTDEDDVLDFYYEGFRSKKAKMSCGHAVTPMSLTAWCRRLLDDEGNCSFVCGQTNCNVMWPYAEVCKMALLTSDERDYFERKMFSNAASSYLNVKECPGCKTDVVRTNLNDLSVKCTVCTAERSSTYLFCWQCLRQWEGPKPRSDRCQNDGCTNPLLERLRNCPDIKFEDVKGVSGCPCVRACPTCGMVVEHSGLKCKNITCPQCKVEFCFVCLQTTVACQRQNPRSYYSGCSGGVAPRQTSIPSCRMT